MRSVLSIEGSRFLINGKLTYSEYPGCPERYRGLLMNARFIQGIFDDKERPERFCRFGRSFDAERNTQELIDALPQWHEKGLRAITVGFQGGGPCFTVDSETINNNPFSQDGKSMDEDYRDRMKKIIEAADRIGMVVIVSCFYGPQSRFLRDDRAVMEAVKTAANWLRDERFTNVIFEVANEHDIDAYKIHPVLYNDGGIVELMEIARRESGGIPVGCSGTGAYFSESITKASDVVLIHGNNMSRQVLYNQIRQVIACAEGKPVVCNEDSQALGNMQVALNAGISWGYYNNLTKQEPPARWGITEGEDRFFAERLADALGIQRIARRREEQYFLQGLDADEDWEGKRWVRLASLYPETIAQVAFYRDGELVEMSYDEPFAIHFVVNWYQRPVEGIKDGEVWRAVISLADGGTVEKTVRVGERRQCDK